MTNNRLGPRFYARRTPQTANHQRPKLIQNSIFADNNLALVWEIVESIPSTLSPSQNLKVKAAVDPNREERVRENDSQTNLLILTDVCARKYAHQLQLQHTCKLCKKYSPMYSCFLFQGSLRDREVEKIKGKQFVPSTGTAKSNNRLCQRVCVCIQPPSLLPPFPTSPGSYAITSTAVREYIWILI